MSVLKGVGDAAGRGPGRARASRRCSTWSPTTPRRYIDGTRLVPIAELAEGDKASVLAEVTRVSRPPSGYGRGRRRRPSRVELEIADDSGRLQVVFFNQAWRAKQLPVGTLALFFGTGRLLPGRPAS